MRLSAVALAVSVFISCSPAPIIRPYMLSPDYAAADFSGRVLILQTPDENNITVENPKDVADDYGGLKASAQSRIVRFYIPLFRETFETLLSGDSVLHAGAGRPHFFDTLEKRRIVLRIENDTDSLIFSIPCKAAMDEKGLDSAVAVVIGRLIFRRNNFYFEYYWDDMTKKQANLEASAKVLIWDFKKDATVFYGTVTHKVEFQFTMQRKHWDESARELAKKIVFAAGCL